MKTMELIGTFLLSTFSSLFAVLVALFVLIAIPIIVIVTTLRILGVHI